MIKDVLELAYRIGKGSINGILKEYGIVGKRKQREFITKLNLEINNTISNKNLNTNNNSNENKIIINCSESLSSKDNNSDEKKTEQSARFTEKDLLDHIEKWIDKTKPNQKKEIFNYAQKLINSSNGQELFLHNSPQKTFADMFGIDIGSGFHIRGQKNSQYSIKFNSEERKIISKIMKENQE
ncbi:hypothetical protein ASO20_02150 [Mycoplasma sp. (ex Biomphalaria glabrata)]|uniref:hypothetical protein n=1 Tax=Mycoplasma sp. (ex Biomphalaria glabrata) TaxID=1749074 RepID=UPI00073A661D|nr:hypothetical protein [Mycoplasma sp. (ex Biomphalaria glabrata)]ALV23443.1 hypothetical protein ASO20_02150 [Mycoplasma sp. (ex Biomphalaria glabrata)]